MQDARYRIQDSRFRIQDSRCKIQDSGYKKVFSYLLSCILYLVSSIFYPSTSYSALPPFWTGSQTISLGQGISTDLDSCSYEDKIYVVWCDDRTGNKEIFFRSSDDAGQTWNKEERLTDTLDESSQPAIACDSKNIYVVWREKNEKKSQIYYKSWDGELWSNDVLISVESDNCRRPDIAITTIIPNSYLYIVWESASLKSDGKEKTTAYLIRSTNDGHSFSAPEPIVQGDWGTKEPAIFCGARDAYVTWVDNREGTWNAFFRRWGESQRTSEVKLSSLPNCSSPSISGAEPKIFALWQCVENVSVYNDVNMSFSSDFGGSWSTSQKLTKGEAESVYPKVSVLTNSDRKNNTQAWFFWQDGRNGEWEIFVSTQEFDGTISEPSVIASSNKPSILADTIVTSGQVHLFWTGVDSSSQSSIFYMCRDTLPPKQPGTPSHFDLTANPGYDDDKSITFSWSPSQMSGTIKYNVYASIDGDDFARIGDTEKTSFDLIGESGKTYRVYVEAVDLIGNVSIPSGISEKIISDPDAPEVMIHSPKSNSTIRDDVAISISVYDANLLSARLEYGSSSFPLSWELLAGPFYKPIDRERILLWDTSGLDGRYVIRLTAIDKAGNESKVETLVDIDSHPPISISSGGTEQLTPSEVDWTDGMPSWSPNGDKIVFYSDEGGAEDLWVMSSDGTNRSRQTRSTSIERHPDWSPTGDMIVFESTSAIPKSELEPRQWKLWLMRSDGSNLKQITSGEGSDTNPAWSPDGSAIAFDSDIDGDSEIWLITNINKVISGSQPIIIRLTDNKWDDKNPEWSSDGSRLIFQSNGRESSWDIMEMNADGTDIKSLIATPADEIEPSWSSDGKWILFSTNESGSNYEIKAVNYPDQSKRISMSPLDIDAHNGQWSPQMDTIIYESQGALFSTKITHPVSDLEAYISSPRGGEILSDKVDINGIARGNNFSKYAIFFLAPQMSNAQQIGGESTSQVIETGFLGKWNTEEIEGKCFLILIVYGKNNEQVSDSVSVMVSNRLPFIIVDEPENGMRTGESIINVKGRAEPRSTVTMNDISVKLNDSGEFSQKIQLTEGANKITIKALKGSDNSKVWTVERTVILDTQPPKLTIESPTDFQVIKVPYINVKGNVDEKAEVSVLSTRVWIDDGRNFQRKISVKEGMNVISISASDSLGHYTSVDRRVIFQKETEIISDIYAPAITDVYPENLAIVSIKSFQISATIIDNIGLDPSTIAFLFDDKEVTDYKLDIGVLDENQIVGIDQFPKITFTYNPIFPISEGRHSFNIQIKDTSENATEALFTFTTDTSPSSAIVSAILADSLDKIRIVVVPNKPLAGIGSVSMIPQQGTGYSVSTLTQKGSYYEAFLDITPSQKNIVVEFSADSYLGTKVQSQGYLAWNIARSGDSIRLGSDNNAQFISNPINIRTGKLVMTLRSQDGLDADTLAMYNNDAEFRRLQLSGLTYVLSASQEFKEGDIQGILGLPAKKDLAYDTKNLVMFKWDNEQKLWQPLDKIGVANSFLSSKISGIGTYAIFADIEPPIIKDVFPTDAKEVPLEKFFVEANVSDIGSGISEINLKVDGKTVNYEYSQANGLLKYFPSELEWGSHKIEITAIDRAGNASVLSSTFMTKEIFQFISVRAYPNPATDKVSIDFKLTRSAEVTLRIYTLTGELVYDWTKSNIAQGILDWECKNNSGNKIASGIYIYVLSARIFQTEIRSHGKIAIKR
jgi:Tol biopolymer transport system component